MEAEEKERGVDFSKHKGGLIGEYEQQFKSEVLGLPSNHQDDNQKREIQGLFQ